MANTKILYLEANKRNVIDKFLTKNTGYWCRGDDGKIDYTRRMHPTPPWIYVKARENQNCHFWHKILFNVLLDQNKVPTACFDCWKVVLMPRNIEELFAAYFMQLHLGHPSKCGTEGDRENTDRLYGAYFYNNSLEQGQETYELVKKTMENQAEWSRNLLGCPIKVKFYNKGDVMPWVQGDVMVEGLPKIILKRGCTEFEQNCGPSDKWESTPDQEEYERLSEDAFVQDFPNFRQSDHQIAQITQKWIHNAFRWGDLSYLKFTNNNRLFSPPVTYHKQPGGKKDGKKRT